MIRVGVIGIGSMGMTHIGAYLKTPGAKVVAIADNNLDRLTGKSQATGNVEGQAKGGLDHSTVKQYDEGMKLIADPDIDLVDICLHTPLHLEYALAALKAGKHVMIEKPLARTSADARKLAAAAAKSKKIVMCGMCMRFWPGWTWLKDAVDKKTYGKVLSAQFRRVASHPGGSFYTNGKACGGAALDLHIHDTDFIHYIFGVPKSVSSIGYSKHTTEIDHIVTQYEYAKIPLVVAEGGWSMQDGFGFKMQYTVNFENATAIFDIGAKDNLILIKKGKSAPVKIEALMGYDKEIAYLIKCIKKNEKPTIVTLDSAATTVKIVEAEIKSVKTGKRVKIS